VPTFEQEFDCLKSHGIALDAFWALGPHAEPLLANFQKRGLTPSFWVMIGAPDTLDQTAKVKHAAAAVRPLAEAAAKAGCPAASSGGVGC
jgi:hypothetical protein